MGSITAANAIFMIAIVPIFPVPVQLQGFAADDIFSMDAVEATETAMGVDGVLSAGFIFVPKRQNIRLQADSDSISIFDYWYTSQEIAKDVFPAVATVTLPSVGKTWALTRGFLKNYQVIPNAGRVLQPEPFSIDWQSVTPSPL